MSKRELPEEIYEEIPHHNAYQKQPNSLGSAGVPYHDLGLMTRSGSHGGRNNFQFNNTSALQHETRAPGFNPIINNFVVQGKYPCKTPWVIQDLRNKGFL